jgi:tetratricopeptide (TPR) repeat protein
MLHKAPSCSKVVTMKRKETRISLVITIVLFVLFITRQMWFLPIYQYLSPRQIKFETLHDLIETINGVIALISSLISIYLLFFNRPSEPQKRELLVPLSLEKYSIDLLGKIGSQVEWFDRGVVTIDTLLGNKHLLIIGKRKVGKTREAFELIQRMIDNNYISADRVYDLGASIRNYQPETARNYVLQIINRNAPNLFYIENLPRQCTGTALEVLSAVVDALQDSHQDYYLIITARSDQLADEHKQWIAKNIHNKVELHKISSLQVIDMVTRFANNNGISLDDGAIEEFVDHSDGTTDQLVHSFVFIHNDKIKVLDKQLAHEYISKSSLEMWVVIWGGMKNEDPDTEYVMKSIATFYRAGVEPYTNYIEKYANFLKNKNNKLPIFNARKEFKIVIENLKANDITIKEGIIHIKDSMVDESIEPSERKVAILELSEYINYLSNRFRLIKNDEHLATICKDLAYQYLVDEDFNSSIPLLNIATKVSLPTDGMHYSLGVAYLIKSQTDYTITEFRKAIKIDPNLADTYTDLGLAYAIKGQTDDAITEFRKAIEIDPNYDISHFNLGITYEEKGQTNDAISEYLKTIKINPNNGKPHIAIARISKIVGDIKVYDQEIVKARQLINPGNNYEYACLECVAGNIDNAISILEIVLKDNPSQCDSAKRDPDLESLHDDPRFQAIVSQVEGQSK